MSGYDIDDTSNYTYQAKAEEIEGPDFVVSKGGNVEYQQGSEAAYADVEELLVQAAGERHWLVKAKWHKRFGLRDFFLCEVLVIRHANLPAGRQVGVSNNKNFA